MFFILDNLDDAKAAAFMSYSEKLAKEASKMLGKKATSTPSSSHNASQISLDLETSQEVDSILKDLDFEDIVVDVNNNREGGEKSKADENEEHQGSEKKVKLNE